MRTRRRMVPRLRILLIVELLILVYMQNAVSLLSRSANAVPPRRSTGDLFLRRRSSSSRTHDYCAYWEDLLLEEHRQLNEDLKERKRHWSRSRLESTGMCVFNAAAEPDSELFGEKIARIYRPGLHLDDKFARGDVLLLTTDSNSMSRDCLVVDAGPDWLNVAVGATWPAGLWESRKHPGACLVRLDRTAPQAPLRAQRTALDLLRRGKGGEGAELLAKMFGDDDVEEYLGAASEIPSRLAIFEADDLQQSIENALNEAKQVISFRPNESQEEAITWALQRNISCLRGPAGTGKSRIAALSVATALRLEPHSRILAVAHSNGAADVLLEALLQMKIPAVRVGRPASVSASLQHRTVVALTDKHPEVLRLRATARDVRLDPHERSAAAYELRQSIGSVQQSILKTAPVVVTSCIGAHQLLEDDGCDAEFSLVVCDEASQTSEPALLCALVAARAEQLVLVGDTRQLPPTISSIELRDSLGVSPMSRLEKLGIEQKTLRVQYRMDPALLQHPSSYFYDGLVVCADQLLEAKTTLPTGFPWPVTDIPLAFVQVGSDLEIKHSLGGRSNPSEAELVTQIVSDFIEQGDVDSTNIAVISPYSKQVQSIRTELALKRHGDVPVGTVDSFQGQETDVVVISCVRSNENGELGFLRDSRRLCVAITRARRGLVVVGDRKALQKCRHWAALLDSFDKRKVATLNARDFDPEILQPRRDKSTDRERIPVGSLAMEDPLKDLFGEEPDELSDLLA